MNVGVVVLWGVLVALIAAALRRGDGTLGLGAERALEQFAKLVPRMLCALVAAGFIAKLIPSELIAHSLGEEAGIMAIVIGSLAGLIVPSGPVIAFSIAAVFARADASLPALVAFIASWSLFAAHRIFIYEIPLLGPSFLKIRLVSVAALPLFAGLIAMAVELLVDLSPPGQH